MNIKLVAEKVGRAPETIRNWEKEFSEILTVERTNSGRNYSDRNLEILLEISRIKHEDEKKARVEIRDHDTIVGIIRAKFGLEPSNVEKPESTQLVESEVKSLVESNLEINTMNVLVNGITRAINESITENTELAEKYAVASRQVGFLEGQVQVKQKELDMTISRYDEILADRKTELDKKLDELKQKDLTLQEIKNKNISYQDELKLISQTVHEKEKSELLKDQEIKNLKDQINQLDAELVDVKNQPWYKFWKKK
jgi:DNA-binding transcriptional MerR regulator